MDDELPQFEAELRGLRPAAPPPRLLARLERELAVPPRRAPLAWGIWAGALPVVAALAVIIMFVAQRDGARPVQPVGQVIAAALPASRAVDEIKPVLKEEKQTIRVLSGRDDGAPDRGGARIERRFGPGRPADADEKETVTFLGIETAPISPTLTAQLGLAEGTGLVVAHVVPDSPAAGALKEHDVLLKLDDQLLIEQRQLAVLVRNHREGDEVTLTYLRGGKQATAKVKLGKHDVPKMAMQFNQSGPGMNIIGGLSARASREVDSTCSLRMPTGPRTPRSSSACCR